MNSLRISLLAALILALTAAAAHAAPTSIDTTFGDDGLAWVTAAPALERDFTVGDAIEIAGGGYASVDERCAADVCETVVSRIDAEGQPVAGFGTAGLAGIAHDTYRFIGKDIAELLSGEFLVVGHVWDEGTGEQNFATALIDGTSGELINGHGTDGIEVWGDWNSYNTIANIAYDPATEGFVAVGMGELVDAQQPMLFEFDFSGQVDASTPIVGPDDSRFLAIDLLVQSPHVYLAGTHIDTPVVQPAVARLVSGALDATWGTDGVAPVAESGFGSVFSIAAAPGGGILAAGAVAVDFFSPTGFVTKLGANGIVDTGFGTDGITGCTAPVDGSCQLTSVDVAADGKLLVGGKVADNLPSSSSLIMRLSATGVPDDSFVAGGEHVFTVGLGSDQLRPVFAAGSKIVYRTVASLDDGEDGLAGAAFGRFEGGPPPTPPVPPTTPPTPPDSSDVPLSIKINTKSKLKASKFKAVTGMAAGTGLARVEIAIQRVDTKLLKKSKKCLYLKNPRGAFGKIGARGGKCLPARALRASGTANWSYRLTKPLKPGKYVISARPVSDDHGKVVTRKLTLTR